MFVFFCCGAFFLYYCFVRLSLGITRSSTCLIGKTALVTGATRGLGYQVALNLASRGCRVIITGRKKLEETRINIVKLTNNTNIATQRVDFSSLESVRSFASDFMKNEKRLDILVNNAGILVAESNDETEDGLHQLTQINYFAHFLLTHLLIDKLKKSAPSRIIFTSSILAFVNDLSVQNLDYRNDATNFFKKLCIYGNSKLAMIIASDIFAKKLKGSGVVSNCVHPGFVKTEIFDQGFSVYKNRLLECAIRTLHVFFAKDPWEGSQTIVHVAVDKKLENESGAFFSDCNRFIKPLKAYDGKFCEAIWEASEKCVKLGESERLKM